jgi:hypothetical protein
VEVYHWEIPDVIYRQRKVTVAGTILYTIQGLTLLAIRLRVPLRACIISWRARKVILSADYLSEVLRPLRVTSMVGSCSHQLSLSKILADALEA